MGLLSSTSRMTAATRILTDRLRDLPPNSIVASTDVLAAIHPQIDLHTRPIEDPLTILEGKSRISVWQFILQNINSLE
jgi:hypothetical protein